MAGYKLISGSFVICGAIAVPTLLSTGDQGVPGAIAITIAALLPLTLQSILVPSYVVQINLSSPSPEKGLGVLSTITTETDITVSYFSHLGIVRSRVEKVGELEWFTSRRWMNVKAGKMKYYLDDTDPSPILSRIMHVSKKHQSRV